MLLVIAPGASLATFFSFWQYSTRPMWRDEWFTYSTVVRPLGSMVHMLAEKDGGLSGFYLVMHVWMLGGDSVAWMRLPAALCTVLLAALTALVARRTAGPAAGVVSGVLVAMMPTVIDHAQEARAYPLVLAAVTATGLAALRYRDGPSTGRWTALAVLGATAAALHPLPGAPAVAGIFLGLLLQPGAASRWRIISAGLPAALVAAALVIVGAAQSDLTSIGDGAGVSQVLIVRQLAAPSRSVLLVMMALAGVAVLALRRRRGPLTILLAWVVVPVLSLATLIAIGSFFEPRYASAFVPAAAVLVGVGTVCLASWTSALSSRHRSVAMTTATSAITIAVVVLMAPAAARSASRPFWADDPRTATSTLMAGYQDGDVVVYSGSMARGLTGFYAGADHRIRDPLLVRSPLESDTVQGEEVQGPRAVSAVRGFERLWVVGTLSGASDRWTSQEKVDSLTADRELVENRDFGRYRIQLWERRSP